MAEKKDLPSKGPFNTFSSRYLRDLLASSTSSSTSAVNLARPYMLRRAQALSCQTRSSGSLADGLCTCGSGRGTGIFQRKDYEFRHFYARSLAAKAAAAGSPSASSKAKKPDAKRSIYENYTRYVESLKHEHEVLQNIVYSFTGIEGSFLQKDALTGKFQLTPEAEVLNPTQTAMLMRLSELGNCHNVVRSYTRHENGLLLLGLVGQAFIASLGCEITTFYSLVSLLQEELNSLTSGIMEDDDFLLNTQIWGKPKDTNAAPALTMMGLLVWAAEPLARFQYITKMCDRCIGKKGGALTTAVFTFLRSGNTAVKALTRQFLDAMCCIIYHMLTNWLFAGEIADPYEEFFVAVVEDVPAARLWYDKYKLRPAMLPVFIPRDFANKILVAGKSVDFLNGVTREVQLGEERDQLVKYTKENPEYIYSPVQDTDFHIVIETMYLKISKKVVEVVMGPLMLFEHLQSMRRFLLFGKGDFSSVLMETLKVELERSANDLDPCDFTAGVDTAIRSTNSHYSDPHIMKHLHVRFLPAGEGDVGWDVVSLHYIINGPLGDLLEGSMPKYQSLFRQLWRMKHMEFVLLSKIWRDQIRKGRLAQSLAPDINKVSYRLHQFTSEMIHFIYQTQYYVLFEVIDCSWASVQQRIRKATFLDEILEAHDGFLATIERDGSVVWQNMGMVYQCIVRLEMWQERFYDACFEEVKQREESKKCAKGADAEAKETFKADLIGHNDALEVIGSNFHNAFRTFLYMLKTHSNPDLAHFATRLDFNNYYGDPKPPSKTKA